jgi:hypothetical protein
MEAGIHGSPSLHPPQKVFFFVVDGEDYSFWIRLLTCVASRVGAALIAAITVRRKEKGIMPDR